VRMMTPNPRLLDILLPAYKPCEHFGTCRQAVWQPAKGHVPRGFLGALGELPEVEVIMVFSEPGFPYPGQFFDERLTDREMIVAVCDHVYQAFQSAKDLFHRNIRWFLDELYPDKSFDEQLRYVWMTEGRLCSVEREIGGARDPLCAHTYLGKQIARFPDATIIAFGGTARRYLNRLNIDFVSAYAMAPPGANHKPARPSWEAAVDQVKSKRLRGT